MFRMRLSFTLQHQCRFLCGRTPFLLSTSTPTPTPTTPNATPNVNVHETHTSTRSDASQRAVSSPACVSPGPYRQVGNVFIVHCEDHPFKHAWEVNRMLRDLRLEFKGQTTIVPDIPAVRKCLWRVRHVVRIDVMDLDEAKVLIGVPEHIHFSDLAAQIPASFGRVRAVQSPVIRSKMNFMKLRRMRIRDVLHRDALELRLLEEKRKALAAAKEEKRDEKTTAKGSA